MQNNYQYGTAVDINEHAIETNKVLRQTYTLLGLSMIPTIIGATVALQTGFPLSILLKSPTMGFLGFIAIFYGLCFAIEKNKTSVTGLILMLVFTFGMGMWLGPILTFALKLSNGVQLISVAAGGTALMFFGLATLGANAEKDFSFMNKFLGVGAIVITMMVLLNFFFLQMSILSLVLSAVFIVFSSFIIIYQVNSVVRGGETNYISAALTIYISIYNIFVSLLRLLMVFSGED